MSEIVQLHTIEQVILQTSSDESITLTGNAINVIATPFDPSVLDDIRAEYQAADTALREELLGIEGGSTVYNGTYDGTTLHSFAGEMSTGAGFLGVGITQEGSQHIQITVPDMSTYTYWYVFAAVSSVSSAVAAFSGAQPPLFFTINKSGSNFEANAVALGFGNQPSTAIATGDVFDVTFTTDSITVLQNGNPYFAGTTTTAVAIPYTHVLSIAPAGFTTPGDLTITGLMPAGAAGIIDTKLSLESNARQNADTDLRTYIDNKISFVNTDLATVQTLAETNQLNLSTKISQDDFNSLANIVTDNGFLLDQKASQADLDTLATEVSTKATFADISAAIAAVVDGAPGALDTLYEIAGELAGNQASINDLLIQINNKVKFDAAQSLTTAQQLQARQNISAEAVGVAAALVAAITAASIGAATAAQGAKADSALQSGDVAPVALSGSYTTLTDKPTIPAAQVNADWNSSSGLSQILNKPRVISQATPLFNRYNSYYPAGFLYDCVYPNLTSLGSMGIPPFVQYYAPFYVLETKTFTSLWVRFLSFPSTGDSYQLGIYDSKADKSGPGNSLYISPARAFSYQSNANNKSETFSISLTVGQVVWLSVLLLSYNGNANVSGTPIGAGSIIRPASTPDTNGMFMLQTTAGITAMPSIAHGDTAFSTAAQGNYMPRLMLGT